MLKGNGTLCTFALLLILFCDRTSSECTQLTSCSCRLANGYGYNLNNLANGGLLKLDTLNYTFYFQPCKNVPISIQNGSKTIECNAQKSVSIGMFNKTADKAVRQALCLGTIEEMKMEIQSGKLFLVFHHENVTTSVKVLCDPNSETRLHMDEPPGTTEYKLMLTSPEGCQVQMRNKGLSTGSVLVILLFVLSGIYFVGGALVLKLLRGATGWEMLPNHEFWCDLPSLVRDGIVFTFNCCRADSYERI